MEREPIRVADLGTETAAVAARSDLSTEAMWRMVALKESRFRIMNMSQYGFCITLIEITTWPSSLTLKSLH